MPPTDASLPREDLIPMHTPQNLTSRDGVTHRKGLIAAVACNVLEFFDFVAYAFFAVQIGRAFFPATSPALSLLLSVAVFGVGFFARPLGSIVIGRYADKVGRRPALLMTAVLMTVGTLGIAITPSFATIGITAPIVITACRLLQGFAFGGEIGPSTAFLLEVAQTDRRASYVSLQLLSQGAATALAGALALGLSSTLGPAEMSAWGWRVPFVVGALLVPVAFYLRTTMPETLTRETTAQHAHQITPRGRRAAHLVAAIFAIAGGTVSTYVGNYMATYSTTVLKLPPAAGLAATIAVGAATVAGALIGGILADRLGRWPMLFWPRLAAAVLTVPAFWLLNSHPHLATLLAVSAALAFLTGMNGSGVLTTVCELFSQQRRATGLALVYAVGVSLFGGSTQFVVTWLIAATGSPLAPAWYVAAFSAIAAAAALLLPETRPSTVSRMPARSLQAA